MERRVGVRPRRRGQGVLLDPVLNCDPVELWPEPRYPVFTSLGRQGVRFPYLSVPTPPQAGDPIEKLVLVRRVVGFLLAVTLYGRWRELWCKQRFSCHSVL